MKFGPIPVAEAEAAILAHSLTVGDKRFRKAHRLSAADVDLIAAAGIAEVIAAVLAADDVGEDAAATALVEALSFQEIDAKPSATGRANLHARRAGVFTVDAALIDAINAVDPAITIATLEQHAPVQAGQMVATVKIIPYAVGSSVLDRALKAAGARPVFAVHPYRAARVAVIQTMLPGLKASVLDKTLRVMRERLGRSGSVVVGEKRVAHATAAVAEAIQDTSDADLTIVFGASAVSDFDDVIPAAIRAAGGAVKRTGMPVDPGNLLVLGEIGGKPVIGAPGCARSPKENGFDWVLDRTLAGLEVTDRDIAGMGVGGLLMEIPTRPEPRERPPRPRSAKVYALVLAAGRSSRMGGPNKLMAEFEGMPLVRRTVERALASAANGVLVVTGHQADRVRAAVENLPVTLADNADFATGLASSLKVGIAALPDAAAGVLIALGDMPGLSTGDLDRMISAFQRAGGRAIVRATHNGKRGNPVILPSSMFGAVKSLEGDTGARHLVESGLAKVIDVELGPAASIDIDTPEAMEVAGGVLRG